MCGFGLDDTNRGMKTNDMSKTVDRDVVILLIHLTAHLQHTHTYTQKNVTATKLFGCRMRKKIYRSHFLSVITIKHSTTVTTN